MVPVKVRSMVAMIPALAMSVIDSQTIDLALVVGKRFANMLGEEGITRLGLAGSGQPAETDGADMLRGEPGDRRLLLTLVGPERLRRLMTALFDESEFLSPHGLRALSAWHRDHPYTIDVEGYQASIDYEPAESTTPLFGGNSNWRGPVWFPVNYLVISVLHRYHGFFGDGLTVEYPTGSGKSVTLDVVAADLEDRLISLFTAGPDGRRPFAGQTALLADDPRWRDNIAFNEYFNGDTGAGLGASHQTGWTGLVADVIRRRHGAVPPLGVVLQRIVSSSGTGAR
jgi:hypothetical protein